MSIGAILILHGDFKMAEDCLYASKDILEKLNDQNNAITLAKLYKNFQLLYQKMASNSKLE